MKHKILLNKEKPTIYYQPQHTLELACTVLELALLVLVELS